MRATQPHRAGCRALSTASSQKGPRWSRPKTRLSTSSSRSFSLLPRWGNTWLSLCILLSASLYAQCQQFFSKTKNISLFSIWSVSFVAICALLQISSSEHLMLLNGSIFSLFFQERLDFAVRDIIFDLLCVGRSNKLFLTPEVLFIIVIVESDENRLERMATKSVYSGTCRAKISKQCLCGCFEWVVSWMSVACL